jgi:hypothetical protein
VVDRRLTCGRDQNRGLNSLIMTNGEHLARARSARLGRLARLGGVMYQIFWAREPKTQK